MMNLLIIKTQFVLTNLCEKLQFVALRLFSSFQKDIGNGLAI